MKIISKKEAASLGLRKYYTGTPCNRGHVSERFIVNGGCCQCKYENDKSNPERKKAHGKKYREANKEKIMEKQKEWVRNNPEKNAATKRRYKENHPDRDRESRIRSYQKHKEKRLIYTKEWSERNPEKRREYAKRHRDNNRDKVLASKRHFAKKYRSENPEKARERDRKHYRCNPEKYFIRTSIARMVSYIKSERNGASSISVGYSGEQLKLRIEFQFKDGMSWGNYGKWHIDHKKPVSRFIKQGITDPKIINALSNLQPLWAEDNLKKSDKWIY